MLVDLGFRRGGSRKGLESEKSMETTHAGYVIVTKRLKRAREALLQCQAESWLHLIAGMLLHLGQYVTKALLVSSVVADVFTARSIGLIALCMIASEAIKQRYDPYALRARARCKSATLDRLIFSIEDRLVGIETTSTRDFAILRIQRSLSREISKLNLPEVLKK